MKQFSIKEWAWIVLALGIAVFAMLVFFEVIILKTE